MGFLAARLVAAQPAAATGRCDVHPIGNPDGTVGPTDALVILRVAVGLLDSVSAPLERADVAPPAEPVASGVLVPGGDGEILAEDALLCLRVAVGLLSLPGNLVVAIESLSPTRPVAGTTATARVRVTNDGDSGIPAGATVSLRRGSPFPGAADGTGTTSVALAAGAAETIDVAFPAGDSAGDSELFARVETPAPELSSEDNFDSFEFEVNAPPVANAGPDVENALEQTTVMLDGSESTDPNDGASSLTFAWTQLAGGPRVDLAGADTAKPTFQAPDISRETSLRFSLRVRDPDGVESNAPDTVAVGVVPINDPPLADAGPDQSDVEESEIVTLVGTADDPNGDALTTRWEQISGPIADLDAPTETTTTLRLPNISIPQVLVFELRVTDDEGAVATDTVEIAAIPGNSIPIARATIHPASSVLEQTNMTLDSAGSRDPDRNPITFTWRQIEGPQVDLSHGNRTATFTAPETTTPTQLRFELLVEDSLGAIGRDEVDLEVLPDPLHPASVTVRVTPTTALVQAPNDTDPAMIVEVEVTPRDATQRVPDGTLVWLSAAPLGLMTEISGFTQLGLFTTSLRPEAISGETLVRAVVPGTSASGETRVTFHDSPDEIGRLSLSLDPPAILRGSDETVQLVAVAYPADEPSGAVPDGTRLEFAASAGTFPSGRFAETVDGVAVVPFEPPTGETGSVQITVTGGAEASATLPILPSSQAAGALRLDANPRTVVAGGPGTTLSAFIAPALRGGTVAPGAYAAFRAQSGLLEGGNVMGVGGISMTMMETDPLPREFDRPPLGDFPGPGDIDADGDGTLDAPGGRVARVMFRHPDPVSEPILVELDSAVVGTPDVTDAIQIIVVPAESDPGSVTLTANRPAVISGGTGATLTANVDSADGDPVSDGTPVEFAVSQGLLDPPSTTTSDGSTTSVVSGDGLGFLTARLRARAQSQGIEDFLDLHLVANRNTPASVDLTLEPLEIPSEGTSDLVANAHVRKADGTPVADGTRVVFDFSAGTPATTSAETVDGVARATLHATAAPGPVEVNARVAQSVVAGSALGSFAPSRKLTATFELLNAVAVGALSIDLPLPKGALPLQGEEGVQIELLLDSDEPPDRGIANEATLAVGNAVDEDDIINIGVITFQPITGTGPLFRLTFDLPPGADFDCTALEPVFFQASDGIDPIPGVDFACDQAVRQDLQ
jgi:hypothetical protein